MKYLKYWNKDTMTEFQFGKDRYHEINDMVKWCRALIGPGSWLGYPNDVWSIEQAFGNSVFRFKNEKDAIMFSLRWV